MLTYKGKTYKIVSTDNEHCYMKCDLSDECSALVIGGEFECNLINSVCYKSISMERLNKLVNIYPEMF